MNSNDSDPNYTVVEYLDDHSGYRCGYCKSTDSNFSHGMWAHRMKVGHYQALIDRGWRRSGKYCYKPILDKICCPQYTIKCDSSQFKLSKSQKKVLRRMHHFLSHGSIKAQETVSSKDNPDSTMKDCVSDSLMEHVPAKAKMKADNSSSSIEVSLNEISKYKDVKEEASPAVVLSKAGTSNCDNTEVAQTKKAKLSQPISFKQKDKSNVTKSLEDYLNEPLPSSATHKLEIRLIQCDLEDAKFQDTFSISFEVFSEYQKTIHGDVANVNSFKRFLCHSPLKPWKPRFGPTHGYGSFHQQYWLDGKLIAVGVLDILPHCVSSVYLYYDPKYSFLSLGTYASLREIELTRMLHKKYSELQWYYMGFYIHNCPKMRYKGNYQPSFLLCPETYVWQPIEDCVPKLDVTKYSRLNPVLTSASKDENEKVTLDKILCLYRSNPILFKDYRKKHKCTKKEIDTVNIYAKNVGSVCAYSMLLYRDE